MNCNKIYYDLFRLFDCKYRNHTDCDKQIHQHFKKYIHDCPEKLESLYKLYNKKQDNHQIYFILKNNLTSYYSFKYFFSDFCHVLYTGMLLSFNYTTDTIPNFCKKK